MLFREARLNLISTATSGYSIQRTEQQVWKVHVPHMKRAFMKEILSFLSRGVLRANALCGPELQH